MNISFEEYNNYVILTLEGNLMEGPDATELNNSLQKIVNDNVKNIIIDLEKISYINSTGLSVIFRSYRIIKKAGGNIKLVNLSNKLENLLEITKLNTLFEIYDNKENALKSLT